MDIETTAYKRCIVVKTSGRIDGSNSAELSKVFKEITDSGTFNIVLDMEEVNFVASAGWWVLIDTQKICKNLGRGELVICNLDPGIRDSLKLVGMDKYFKIFNDLTESVGSF